MVIGGGHWHLAHPHTDKAILGQIKRYKGNTERQREGISMFVVVVDGLPIEKPNLCRPCLPIPADILELWIRHLLLRRHVVLAATLYTRTRRRQVIIFLTHKITA